jgi:hypothetical protein
MLFAGISWFRKDLHTSWEAPRLSSAERLEERRGICVLSHTNVAVEEIKRHVARHYPEIMEYPNFIGTVQEFANQFLFAPYLAAQGMRIRFQAESRYLDVDTELASFPIVTDRVNKHIRSLRSQSENMLTQFYKRLNSCYMQNGLVFARTAWRRY